MGCVTISVIFLYKYFEQINNWQASKANETLSGVYKFELVQYMCIYMYGGMCAIIIAHATHT